LFGPSGIALDLSLDTLYIADSFNHRVMRYLSNASSGTVVAGGNGPGMNNTQLWNPYGLAFDSSSNSLLITNFNSHNVVRWVVGENSWTLVAGSSTGVFGDTSTLLYQPIGVALDSASNMFVADSGNHRIQLFLAGQSNGTTVAGIKGSPGSSPGQLNTPFWAVVDDQRNIYVSGNNNNRVQLFLNY
jgi:sugar lactone lactonase YvrE